MQDVDCRDTDEVKNVTKDNMQNSIQLKTIKEENEGEEKAEEVEIEINENQDNFDKNSLEFGNKEKVENLDYVETKSIKATKKVISFKKVKTNTTSTELNMSRVETKRKLKVISSSNTESEGGKKLRINKNMKMARGRRGGGV